MSDGGMIEIRKKIPRSRRLRVAYNNSQSEPGRKVAAIRISGVYLEDLGFKAGHYMDVIINDDRTLTLKSVSLEQHKQEEAARNAVKKTGE